MKNKHLVFLLFVVFLFAGATNCIAQRTVDRHTKTTTKWTKPLQSKRPGADKYKEVTDGTRKQSEPATITEAQWQKLTQGKDYGYKNDKENDTEVPKHSAFFDFLERLFFFFASPVGTFILWTLLISLVLFVVYKIFLSGQTSLFRREKKKDAEETIVLAEKSLMDTEWEALLNDAIRKKDYRLAVRYSYMLLLQLLQQHDLIAYRSDKTNHDYFAELDATGYKQPFRQLARQYEYAWYGNYPLIANAYSDHMNLFNSVKNQLSAS